MEKLYKAWRDYDVAFFYVYTREPHPGYYGKGQTRNVAQRRANAKQCEKDLSMTLPWIIDDMKSTIQEAYGDLPNSAYIITSKGKIFYKEAWANAGKLNKKLKELYRSNPELQAAAAEHLKINILSQKDPSRRAQLGLKLAKMACKDACKALIEVFRKEKETTVRVKLSEAFAFTKQKECIEFLITLLDDQEQEVRAAAIGVLKKLTGESFDFDPAAGERQRAKSRARWRAWWRSNKDKLAWSDELERFKVKKQER